MAFPLTDSLRAEYKKLFDTCDILPAKFKAVDDLATRILDNQPRYQKVGDALNVPWFFVGVTHCLESSLSFTKHLHNGDPLTRQTVQVPKGRPLQWNPPNDWESSADDALRMRKLQNVKDWTIPGLLYQLEGFNGYGYRTRHPEVLTPYLWSFSSHYTSGKYVSDGTFDPNAVSKQCGCAVLLRRLSEKGAITFNAAGNPLPTPATTVSTLPLVVYAPTKISEAAKTLQRALNGLPGIFLLVDGKAGKKTSDAFFKTTGHFLKGDPRET